MLVQLVFTAGARADPLGADGALPRHPRHPVERADVLVLRHADHLPVVPGRTSSGTSALFDLNPFTHLAVSYQEILFFHGPVGHWKWLLALGGAVDAAVSRRLLAVRSAARFVRGGGVTRERDRAHQRLEDLPPLRRPAVRDAQERAAAAQHPARPAAERDVPGADRRVVHGAEGLDLRRHRPQRIGQEHRAEAGGRHHQADQRHRAVDGRISALIELGAGFHPEISGRENVFINGIMLGLTKREIQERFDEIVDFAELREFIDAPVKTYSSGMYMRLGFAVAIHVDPDVLLVDEVLAVGDEGFTHKCLDKFAEFRRRGKTILLVTHSLEPGRAVLRRGAVARRRPRDARHGDPKRVVDAYLTKVEEGEEQLLAADDGARRSKRRRPGRRRRAGGAGRTQSGRGRPADPTSDMFQATEGRWGSREVEITDVAFLDRDGQPSFVFHSGDPMSIRLKVRAHAAGRRLRVRRRPVQRRRRVLLRHQHLPRGDEARAPAPARPRSTFAIESLDLVEGTYKLDVAVHKRDGFPYDYHRLLYTFRVKSRTHDVGIYRPRHRWTFSADRAVQTEP